MATRNCHAIPQLFEAVRLEETYQLGCLLAGCLDFNVLGFYGPYNIGFKSLAFWSGPEDS